MTDVVNGFNDIKQAVNVDGVVMDSIDVLPNRATYGCDHTGTDFAMANLSNIFATTTGYVVDTRTGIPHYSSYAESGSNSEGNYVLVEDQDGNTHHYAHLSSPSVETDTLILPAEQKTSG